MKKEKWREKNSPFQVLTWYKIMVLMLHSTGIRTDEQIRHWYRIENSEAHPLTHAHVLCWFALPDPFPTFLYSTLALRGWLPCISSMILPCPVIPRWVWPLRGDIITDPYDHFNRYRKCNVMGNKNNIQNRIVFYTLGKCSHKLKNFKGYL